MPTVFSEPQADVATAELPVEGATIADDGSVSAPAGVAVFAVEFLPGQFDQRADSASECVQLISQGERPDVRSAKVYVLEGELPPPMSTPSSITSSTRLKPARHPLRRARLCICRS